MSARITGVALRLSDGRLWTTYQPGRHHHVISSMRSCDVDPELIASAEQGFIDADGKFLNRKAALMRAEETGQLKRDPKGYDGPELFSEDLW